MADVVNRAPAAPKVLPPELQKKWTDTHNSAFAEAQETHPNDTPAQHAAAHREANRMLRVPEPKSASDIKALASWQVVHRGEREGNVFCVTIDGKKFSFPADKPAPKAADKK